MNLGAHVIFYHLSKEVIEDMQATSDHDKVADKLFAFIGTELQHWSKSGPFPSQLPASVFNRGFANPVFDKIRAYFWRFGYSDYKRDVYSKLGPNSVVVINMLNHMVDIRNNIAHGNAATTKTPSEIEDMVRLVSVFCRTTDWAFGSWCRQSFAAIR